MLWIPQEQTGNSEADCKPLEDYEILLEAQMMGFPEPNSELLALIEAKGLLTRMHEVRVASGKSIVEDSRNRAVQ